ncbi:lysophospholipid acyltransferase family protein [Undibacterium squillarum]|uniref:lysophospholipid acyltransferase family protein n=1 Tax=Undibacterium squillarum TaxID=1131567 RepID=UPI0035AF161C
MKNFRMLVPLQAAALRVAYRAANMLPYMEPMFPEKWQLGKFLQNNIPAPVQDLLPGQSWLRQVQRARLQSDLLRRYAGLFPQRDWRPLIQTSGAVSWDWIREQQRPIIIVTPHFGSFAFGSLALAQSLPDKIINVFYDDPANNAANAVFFDLLNSQPNIEVLYNNPRGLAKAVRALKQGQILTMFPDVYQDIRQTGFVPFLDRYLRVMPGTAYLARKNQAMIIPAYSWPSDKFGAHIWLDAPLLPEDFSGSDERQHEFAIMCALFRSVSARVQAQPEYWHYWERLAQITQDIPGQGLTEKMRDRVRRVPGLLQQFPELQQIL